MSTNQLNNRVVLILCGTVEKLTYDILSAGKHPDLTCSECESSKSMSEPLTIHESAFTVRSVYKFFANYFVVVLLLTAVSGLGAWIFVSKQPAIYSMDIKFYSNVRTIDPKTVFSAIMNTESMKPFVLVSRTGDYETPLPFELNIRGKSKFIFSSKVESVFADKAPLNERRALVREFFDKVQMEAIHDLKTQLLKELSILQRQTTRQDLSIGNEVVLRLTSLETQLDELRNVEKFGLLGFGKWELKNPRWVRIVLASLVGGFGAGVLLGIAHSAHSRIKSH